MLRVAALWRYPVKSLQGEPLDATDVGQHGFVVIVHSESWTRRLATC